MNKIKKLYFDFENKFKQKPLKYYIILLIIAIIL